MSGAEGGAGRERADEAESENPWWGTLLGWPIILAVVAGLLAAPIAVKLAVARGERAAAGPARTP